MCFGGLIYLSQWKKREGTMEGLGGERERERDQLRLKLHLYEREK